MKSGEMPEPFNTALGQILKQEPMVWDFQAKQFSITLISRHTAVINRQPDHNEYELISLWTGCIKDSRVAKGKNPNKVPVFVREYIHLPVGEAKMSTKSQAESDKDKQATSSDNRHEEQRNSSDDRPNELPFSFSAAMKESEAYSEAQQDGYFLTPDHLLTFGYPVASLRPSLQGCRYHVLIFYERRLHDRLLAPPTIKASPQALEDIQWYSHTSLKSSLSVLTYL